MSISPYPPMNQGALRLAESIREDFPVLARRIDGNPIVYLDNAATSLTPRAVIDAIVDYYANNSANIHRGKHYLSEEASAHYERARYKTSQYLGVPSNEIVFVSNTTAGLNLVASGLELNPGDLVLSPLDAHHSNLLPWRRAATVELIRVDSSGRLDVDHYRDLLRRGPKVVALSHCSNVTGIYAPLEQLVPMAKDAGALVVVDAAQSMPHRRAPIRELDIDFFAFSAHKMLGPTGLGVLYAKQALLDRMEPVFIGGGTVDWVDVNRYALRKIPHRFEPGTPHIAGVCGLGAAIEYLEQIGPASVAEHDQALARLMLDEAMRRPYLRVLGGAPDADRAALISMTLRGCDDLSDVARMLSDSYGVMCRSGHLCAQPLVDAMCEGEILRASAYIYNTADEIDLLFRALDEIYESLGL